MRYLFILSLTLLLIACEPKGETNTKERHQGHELSRADSTQPMAEQVIYFTCPMEEHKHIHSAEPGKCPECGMNLAAGVVTSEDKMEFYGCPMLQHSHVRSDTAGTCAECGMTLKPMRLLKEKSESM